MVLGGFFHVIFVLLVLKNESSHVIDKYSTNETHHLSYFAILLLTSEFAKYSWMLDVRRKCQASHHIEERKLHSSTAQATGHGSDILHSTPSAVLCIKGYKIWLDLSFYSLHYKMQG